MKLGTLGEKMTLQCRQGATLGPFIATMKNPDGSNFDLTGAQIRGFVKPAQADATPIPLEVSFPTPTSGEYYFGLAAETTATIPGGATVIDPASQHSWYLELVDTLGRVTPLYYGSYVSVQG